MANCAIAFNKAQTHFHKEHLIDSIRDFLVFGYDLILRFWAYYAVNQCSHTAFVSQEKSDSTTSWNCIWDATQYGSVLGFLRYDWTKGLGARGTIQEPAV